MSELKIDKGKKRTLERLSEKGEGAKSYPIEESDLIRAHNCNLCGSKKIVPVTEVYLKEDLNFFSTSFCGDCLYTFRNVSPSFNWFEKCWKAIATDKLEVFNPEIEKIREERYERYLGILSKYAGSGKLLEIGAAYGTGARVLQKHGFEVEVIESEDNKVRFIEQVLKIPVKDRSIEHFLSSEEKYDVITFAHCLEHLDNPKKVISGLGSLLKPEGILYLEVPLLWNHVTWNDAFYLTHKSNFTKDNLSRFLMRNNFEIKEETNFKHSEEEPTDFGLIMKVRKNNRRISEQDWKPYHPEEIKDLYRKNLPSEILSSLGRSEVIRYSVDSIEHFYQTIRLDNKEIQKPNERGFITFQAIN